MARRSRLRERGGHCCICGMPTIYGLSIMDRWICPQCEDALVGSDATGKGYDFALARMKDLWDGRASSKGRDVWLRP